MSVPVSDRTLDVLIDHLRDLDLPMIDQRPIINDCKKLNENVNGIILTLKQIKIFCRERDNPGGFS